MPKQMPRRIEYLPLGEIQRADENPKGHDGEGIAASIDRLGYVEAGVIDGRTGKLLGGHGRLEVLTARKEAGQDPPDGVEVRADGEWLVPVQTGWSSADDTEADAAALALNQLTIAGGYQEDPLTAMLARLASTPRGLAGTGFGRRDLASMLRRGDTRGTADGEADDADLDPEPVRFWLIGCPASLVDRMAPLVAAIAEAIPEATISQETPR